MLQFICTHDGQCLFISKHFAWKKTDMAEVLGHPNSALNFTSKCNCGHEPLTLIQKTLFISISCYQYLLVHTVHPNPETRLQTRLRPRGCFFDSISCQSPSLTYNTTCTFLRPFDSQLRRFTPRVPLSLEQFDRENASSTRRFAVAMDGVRWTVDHPRWWSHP